MKVIGTLDGKPNACPVELIGHIGSECVHWCRDCGRIVAHESIGEYPSMHDDHSPKGDCRIENNQG